MSFSRITLVTLSLTYNILLYKYKYKSDFVTTLIFVNNVLCYPIPIIIYTICRTHTLYAIINVLYIFLFSLFCESIPPVHLMHFKSLLFQVQLANSILCFLSLYLIMLSTPLYKLTYDMFSNQVIRARE